MENKYFLLIALFFALSCNKDTILEKGTVYGTVRDKTTNEGIEGATVYLLSHIPSGGFGGGGGSTQLDFTASNADGSFSFQLDYDSELAYTCAATHDLYFDYGDEFPVLEEIKVGENVDISIYPKGWLSLHVKSINIYDEWDYINLSNAYLSMYGGSVDTTIILNINGNYTIPVVWFIYDDGLTTGGQTGEIYCPSFDTTYFEILY